MTRQAIPFLMFQGHAAQALELYQSLFSQFELHSIEHYDADDGGTEGQVKAAEFSVAGLRLRCFDSPIAHQFDFTPSFSIFVECENEAEVDELAARLGSEGMTMMPPDNYGFSRRFAWVSDRYKVSWQLNFASS